MIFFLSIIRKLVNSVIYSMHGFAYAIKVERSFQIELAICVLAVILTFVASPPLIGIIFIMFSIGLLLMAELINTAIEIVSDLLIGYRYHRLIGAAKDLGSAAVFIAIVIMSVVSAIYIVVPIFWKIISALS